jgi:hypothetical protein
LEEALSFFRAFETWIYLFLGLWGLIFIRRFILAWQELRGAVFGLEREKAQVRLNQSASILVLLLSVAVVEFILVSFIAPALPGANLLPTPTLDLLATPTTTLAAGEARNALETEAFNAEPPQATQIPGCIPGQIEISSPTNGQEISGVFEITGAANIPNFGFYKFEIKRPDEGVWLTIQAGNAVVNGGKLGDWDTTRLTPGEYQLGLVVVDNQAQASPACIIQVRVTPPPLE